MAIWTCPYCRQKANPQQLQRRSFVKVGDRRAYIEAIFCPNPDCKKSGVQAALYSEKAIGSATEDGDLIDVWPLIPVSRARPWPKHVHARVREDYEEACKTEFLSPKASAALARRCLQTLLADFFGLTNTKLVEQIDALDGEGGEHVLDALVTLRAIGNVAATATRDSSVIVDVEPGEATAMIDLIELLIEETYIAREDRNAKMARIKEIAARKPGGQPAVPGPRTR
jgi:hypothetical protein